MTAETMPTRAHLLALLLVLLAVWFANLEYRKLVRPDEGRYAEIPREMVAGGDWVTPRLNAIKYFEKPPLQYWATAAAYEIFGEHHWTARLWPALTGLAGILLICYAGSVLFGAQAGLYAALALASSFLYVLIGHLNTLDMGVTFFLTLGLCGFLLAQRDGATRRQTRNWMWITWAALGCSVLSKGLIGLALPGAVLVLYTLVQRDFALWKRLHLASGLAILLAFTVPWFVAVSHANPEFFHFFFIHEHFERFLTKAHGRYQPWWYFVPILAAGMLPWLIVMFDALARAWRKAEGRFQPQRFLLVWTVFIYFFFSISSSKLPSYILPIFPALALLIGARLSAISARTLFWQVLPVALLAAAALAMSPQVVKVASDEVPLELYRNYVPWLLAASATMLMGATYACWQCYHNKLAPAVIALGITGLVAAQLGLSGHDSLSPSNSAYHVAQKIKPYLRDDAPFYSVATYEQTLPFYIKRPVTLVAFQDEMAFGLQQEPQLWLPDLAAFEQAWRQAPYALALMAPETYAQLQQSGLPMQEIARDTRRVIVKTIDREKG
ncbi:MAG: glycosyltransferase family 39 protein [Pseudomonadota bacterium]